MLDISKKEERFEKKLACFTRVTEIGVCNSKWEVTAVLKSYEGDGS